MAGLQRALKNVLLPSKGVGAPKRSSAPSDSADTSSLPPTLHTFPSQYPAHALVHTVLIVSSFLLLPQTALLDPVEPTRNLDKPQHPFLAPLTARPELTAAWSSVGSALVVGWWAGSIREWVREGKMGLGVSERMRDFGQRKVCRLPLVYDSLTND